MRRMASARGNAENVDANWANYGYGDGINFNMNASGGYTFAAPKGKKFTKIEMTIYSYDGWYTAAYNDQLGSGWPSGEDAAMTVYSTNKVTWTDDATSTVDLLTDAGLSSFGGATVSSIDFYFEAPSGPTVIASGDCGTGVTYSLTDDGTLTISGTGAMADYTAASGQPWYSYVSSITSVVVEAGVTHIGNNSLRNFTNMTTVTLPDGLETIGANAFQADMHTGFTEVNIPASVTSIGAGAFSGCKYLATVTFSAGSNLTGIGDNAFNSCLALSTIKIPAGVTSIGLQTFFNCDALTSIEIPASVTSIGNKAFFNCDALTSVTLKSNPYLGGTSVYTGGATVTMNLTANAAGGAYWMTFYNQNYDFEADANTKVFKAALTDTELELTELTTDQTVTKNNAVILKSTASPIVMTKTSTASSNDFSGNSLQGVSAAAGLTAADPSTTFVLNNGTGGVGFYRLKSGKTVGVGKAYLTYAGALAREFFLFDEATDIEMPTVEDVNADAVVYDLQGRRVVNPTKGLYIVNGKKVFINK